MQESQEETGGLRRGILVFVGLAVLTAIEFGIAIGLAGSLPLLAVVAVAKTVLILEYFMHLSSLFRTDEGGH
jgi:heme/copper-type cytochrome/quinol oxidase subunit 4